MHRNIFITPCSQGLKVEANRENGLGRTDSIIFEPYTNRAVIFEIKHLKMATMKASTYCKIPLFEVLIAHVTRIDAKVLTQDIFFTQEVDPGKRKKLLTYLAKKHC